jgi:hypothetical protein
MIEIQNTDSLFYLSQNEHEAVVVTTNGVIRKNGDAVLGKGQALEAKKLVPGLEHQLGEYLRRYGNRAFYMGVHRVEDRLTSLVTFPTKHHYCDNSDLNLIMRSAVQLKEIAAKFQLSKIYLPPVGCGLGKLDYEKQVRPVLNQVLDDDRFVVVLGYKGL